MTTRTVDQVGNWESRSFSGGYRGLQELSDERFSGIVTAGPTRLCMTKGKVVGVLDGDIENFEGASGTVHEAPSPALPLLAVMQERSDEVRAQYYTEETPISEVDQTLTDGNFTGYVELSENVLSGDYYIVYHQGRSMNVAWVGESQQLLIEDEAFDRTNGEVGIYKVKPVDIDVIEIPASDEPAPDDTEPTETASTDSDAAAEADPAPESDDELTDEPDTDAPEPDDPSPASSETAGDTGAVGSDGSQSRDGADGGAAEQARADSSPDQSRAQQSGTDARSSASQSPDGQRQTQGQTDTQPQGRESPQRSQTSRSQGGAQPGSQPTGRSGGQSPGSSEMPPTGQGGPSPQQRDGVGTPTPTEAVGELETRSIPSLDPDRTSASSEETSSGPTPDRQPNPTAHGSHTQDAGRSQARQQPGNAGRQQSPGGSHQQSAGPSPAQQPAESRGQPATRQQDAGAGSDGAAAVTGEQGDLEAELQEREAEIERLESELETAEGERDDLEAELEDVRAERDELQDRVEQLERRVSELRSEDGGESIADRRRMSPGEVIDGTNLFVRYQSKGDATLESAYNGNAEPTAVNDNLDIQHHTQFDADDVAVNGEPFMEFLHGTLQYQFVRWAVRVLPYEIRDTGHEGSLSDLYEALPEIDRAELNGTISVVYEEEGQEQRSQETFDVVLRDRMGNPLVVANMNESRQPASQSKMEGLITASQRVGESKESLAGSFLVTSSFFEPEAMEAAEEATGSGLLSRDKRESFVKLSRKEGFHLCLVQYLDGQFELSVPEL